MKRIYEIPDMEIEVWKECDVVTLSNVDDPDEGFDFPGTSANSINEI